MGVESADIHQTLEYRADAMIAGMLPFGLGLCCLGLFGFVLAESTRPEIIGYTPRAVASAVVVLAGGLGWTAIALWRRRHPGKPHFVLSPMGIRFPSLNDALIPWHAIKGVDTIPVTGVRTVLFYKLFRTVTAVLVSKEFYDAHFVINAPWRRGPIWHWHFIPNGPWVQVALHHDVVAVDPRVLRAAIEARWHAFRDRTTGSASDDTSAKPKRTSVPAVKAAGRSAIGPGDAAARPGPTPSVVAAGADPKAISAWLAVRIATSLIGIVLVLTNLLGLWATPGQTKAREERRAWQEHYQRLEEESRKLSERATQIQKDLEEHNRRVWRTR